MTSELRLLLVEDDPLISLPIEEVFTDAGFAVTTAADGPAAMAKLAADKFAAVVTDIALPGSDGWAVARRARELNPDIAVVYTFGSGIAGEKDAVENGVVLPKPYTIRDLLLAVVKLIA